MKPKSAVPISSSTRCSHLSKSGRRCRALSADGPSGLCAHHRALQSRRQAKDFTKQLTTQCQGFQTAQGVNFALCDLYKLLAANLISARRASVLAFINSLILRTLPAIDADREAGIEDPTASGNDDESQRVRLNPPPDSPEPIVIDRPNDAVLSPLAEPESEDSRD